MIPIEQITESKLFERYDSLPKNLLGAIDDPATLSAVNAICEDHHVIDAEKTLIIQQLVSFVVLGFVHDYDLGREINETLALENPRLANEIASAISAKIFAPIKTDLAKNYRPLVLSYDAEGTPTLSPEIKAPLPPKEPFRVTEIEVTEIKPPPALAPRPAYPPPPPKPPQPGVPAPQPSPAQPFVMYKGAETAPIKPAAGFKIEPPTRTFKDLTAPKPPPPKPAELELGGATATQKPTAGKTEVPKSRVVHYSEYRTPLNASQPQKPAQPGGAAAPIPLSQLPQHLETVKSEYAAPPPPPPSTPPRPVQSPRPAPPPAPPVPPIMPPRPPAPPPTPPPAPPQQRSSGPPPNLTTRAGNDVIDLSKL